MQSAPPRSDEALHEILARVEGVFDGLFVSLESWIPQLVAELQAALTAEPGAASSASRITGAQLAALVERGANAILDGTARPLYGAGFCASEAVVSEGNPLAWWQGAARTLLASSTFGPGQASIDLARLEWYRVPERTGTGHVAGPFVDYLCSNEITLTSALPVIVDGVFWGVVCADMLVQSLEGVLEADFAAIDNVTLVNASGRVVMSADPDYETGDRYAGARVDGGVDSLDESVRVVSSARYPFSLVLPA